MVDLRGTALSDYVSTQSRSTTKSELFRRHACPLSSTGERTRTDTINAVATRQQNRAETAPAGSPNTTGQMSSERSDR